MDGIVFSYMHATVTASKHPQCNVKIYTYADKFT